MQNIVLIGASGFVGSAILNEALLRGHKVTAISRNIENIPAGNPNLTVVRADATDPDTLAALAQGKDAVISAYNPGWGNPRQYEETLENYPKIVEGTKKAGVKRLLIVGGAGTLFVAPGLRLVDTGNLPDEWLPGIKSLGEFYLNYLTNEKDIDWVFFSPAGNLGNMGQNGPGKRTGKFRLGKDDMIFDENGESFISVEDYAWAMIDELEQQNHHQERFTAAY
ncbi:MAG: NAD(P)-dependent oxidoreductase [Candidatus Cryptobacteroides sp.]